MSGHDVNLRKICFMMLMESNRDRETDLEIRQIDFLQTMIFNSFFFQIKLNNLFFSSNEVKHIAFLTIINVVITTIIMHILSNAVNIIMF